MVNINTLKAHLALNVKDVGSSIEFYKKLFGVEPSKARTGYAKFDVQNPPLNFTLNQVAFDGPGALSHLGIQVAATEDVIALRDQWKASGLMPREEMQTTCCYALQDKAWVRDPDGNEWEVFVVLEDNLSESLMKSDVAGCECAAEASHNSSCCTPTSKNVEGTKQEVATACC